MYNLFILFIIMFIQQMYSTKACPGFFLHQGDIPFLGRENIFIRGRYLCPTAGHASVTLPDLNITF